MLPVVILSGGLATRLYPVTQSIPKAFIEILGIPFIDHQLTLLQEKGIQEVVLCVGQFGELIEEHVQDGSQFGLNIQYSYDGENLLGTGGAIKNALPHLPDAFIILYGDSYLDIDYGEVVRQFDIEKLPVLMTVYRNLNEFDRSNVIVKGNKVSRYSKGVQEPGMEFIDYGMMVSRKNIFEPYPPEKPFDLSSVLSPLADSGQIAAFEVSRRFYEIGSFRGILDTEEYIRKRGLSTYCAKNERQ